MIGWLKGQETLYAKDTRSILIRAIMRNIDDNYPFKMKYENAGRSSDHYPFYQNNIPVSFITTGMEEVYHTPNDDADLIDYDGLKLITDFVFELLCLVDTIEERPVVPSNH
jgi:Zn-dependent M28 family amino/carboxypeptidase